MGFFSSPKGESLTLRQQKIKSHVDDLIENTSMHGILYIFDKEHRFRQALWFIFTVSMISYSVQKVIESTQNYLSFPSRTTVTRQYVQELDFPAISICNLNDMRYSKLTGTPIDEAIIKNDPDIMGTISANEYRRLLDDAAHTIDDMIIDCKFDGQPCTADNFTIFFHKQGEKCFTFNSGHKKNGDEKDSLKISGTGFKRGLDLTLNLEHFDYYRDRPRAGIHLMLHGQDETPVLIQGPIVAPGFSTYFELNKKKFENLPPPYKTMCGTKNLHYFKGYSQNLCWLDSVTYYVVSQVGCKDYFMPGKSLSVCEQEDLVKVWQLWEKHDKDKNYTCPVPCVEERFQFKMSRSKYPSVNFAATLNENVPSLKKLDEQYGRSKTQIVRDNVVRMVIYFDTLSYELVKQQPSYDTISWIGDVGGTIGLFVGAGVMTYVEFFDTLAMVIWTKFFERIKEGARKNDSV